MYEMDRNDVNCHFKETGQTILPYEKFNKYGPESLTNAELLAIFLRTGTKEHSALEIGQQILSLGKRGSENQLIALCQLDSKELMQVPGIGLVKAIQMCCLVELSKRMALEQRVKTLSFDNPKTVANYFMERLRHLTKEQVILVLLDYKGSILKEFVLTTGTSHASLISVRDILIEALKGEADGICVVHNHPSGDCTPSHQDCLITQQLYEATKLIDIILLDHIIIGDNTYYSFMEHGVLGK